MSFSTDVHRIAKDMETTVEKQAAAIFIDLFSSVIKDTPVDTGRLRSSIVTTKATQTDLVARTEVGVNYAPYIEFGTRSKVNVPSLVRFSACPTPAKENKKELLFIFAGFAVHTYEISAGLAITGDSSKLNESG